MPGALSGTLYYYGTGRPINDIPGDPRDQVRAFASLEASTTPDHSTGKYFILNLPPDSYQVEADLVGFSLDIAPDVPVLEGQTTVQDFALSFAGGISGSVMSQHTGAPIVNAQVEALQVREPYVGFGIASTVAPSGTFLMDNLQAVDLLSRDFTYFDVIAGAEGHSAALHQSVQVRPGKTTGLVFWLNLPATFSAVVKDEAGNPLPEVVVSVTQTSGLRAGMGVVSATNSAGEVAFSDLQAPATHQVDVLPGPAYSSLSRTYSVVPGDAITDIFTLSLVARITGLVLDSASGQPIANASVYVWGPNDEVERVAWTDTTGRYTVYGLYWPATFSVEAMAEGYSPASTTVDVTADAEFQAPTLYLAPAP